MARFGNRLSTPRIFADNTPHQKRARLILEKKNRSTCQKFQKKNQALWKDKIRVIRNVHKLVAKWNNVDETNRVASLESQTAETRTESQICETMRYYWCSGEL